MPKEHQDNFIVKYLLTISAAAVAETVTFPLDITKTRLQIQGQKEKLLKDSGVKPLKNGIRAHRGMLRTLIGIIREESVFGLWKGLSPAVLRHTVYSGCRMMFYEIIRDHVFKRNSNGQYPLWKAIPTGMIAGAMGQFLASPTDLVKVRLQMEGRRVLDGYKPRYKSTWNAFYSILKSEGITGLWKGWVPNCQRAAIVCLGDLTTYDTVKQAILRNTNLQDNAVAHALSSACSGVVSATLGTPADVMKTRMMNQPYGSDGKGLFYRSTINCFVQTVKGEGFGALYKGFLPTWSRMAPWSLTFWLVYEEVRVIAGVGNF